MSFAAVENELQQITNTEVLSNITEKLRQVRTLRNGDILYITTDGQRYV